MRIGNKAIAVIVHLEFTMEIENKNTSNSDCGCDPYLLSLVETQDKTVKKSVKSTGILLASVTGGAAILLSAVCFPFVSPALRRVNICFTS